MNYLLDKKIKRKKLMIGAIIVLFFSTLFYFRDSVFAGFSAGASFIFKPVISVGQSLGERISDLNIIFKTKDSLEKENEILAGEIRTLQAQLENYRSLEKENLSLKEILGRNIPERNLVLATILGASKQSSYGTLLLDAGISVGIKEGNLVFAEGVIPIGKIAEVNQTSSKVLLFSTPGEITEADLGGTYFPILGRGEGNFEVETPRDYVLTKGQEILLPGMTPYILARVEGMLSDPKDAFKRALLISPVNLRELKFVQIKIE